MTEQKDEYNASMFSNQNTMNPTFIQLRLDTTKLLNDVEMFLSGKQQVVHRDEEGNDYIDYTVLGEPLANRNGVTCLLNIMRLSMMNEHVVQGNLSYEEVNTVCINARKELAEDVVKNCYNWGIADHHLNTVVDSIIRFFRLFISRTKDNEERKSYMQQFVSKESFSQGQRRGLLPSFGKGGEAA